MENFVIPAEWEKHKAVWLAWPHDKISFPPGHLEKAEESYLQIIKALSGSEQVFLLVPNAETKDRVFEMVKQSGADIVGVSFYITDYADVWLIDIKGDDYFKDNNVFYNLKNKIKAPMKEADMVLEGGSIEQNGCGTVLTTEQCLLYSGRNPDLTKEQIENNLKSFLGASNIIWLKQGLKNDHTDGHVDDIAKFVSRDTIFCAYEEDKDGDNYSMLRENFEKLKKAVDQDGKPFKLIKLQVPRFVYDENKPFEAGNIAPASYVNFYIGNKVVLVPTYNDKNDGNALSIIQSYFPTRKVVGIDCRDLIYGGGSIHCMTQQEPTS